MDLTATDPRLSPSPLAWAAEVPRALIGLIELGLSVTRLRDLPRGDGRPVLQLPGLVNSDRSNIVLDRLLSRLGYRTFGWQLGRNFGPRSVGSDAERLIERVEAVHAEAGEKVTLVGVSLGGIMARIVAHRRPDLVREVITISSPFAGSARATNVWRAYQLLSGERIDSPAALAWMAEAAAPLPVPSTAIWSRSDGLVNGLNCHSDADRAIEVRSSHMGVQFRRDVLRAVAEVLAGRRG
jgi:pimeloyl-ACP methyl ester carboxylesterase